MWLAVEDRAILQCVALGSRMALSKLVEGSVMLNYVLKLL